VLVLDEELSRLAATACILPGKGQAPALHDEHLAWLKGKCEIVPYRSALEAVRVLGDIHAVAVTFDDAFADNHHLALPLLVEHHAAATLFLLVDAVDLAILMSSRDSGDSHGISSFGRSSGVRSPRCKRGDGVRQSQLESPEPRTSLRSWLGRSSSELKWVIETRTQHAVSHFAYPFGGGGISRRQSPPSLASPVMGALQRLVAGARSSLARSTCRRLRISLCDALFKSSRVQLVGCLMGPLRGGTNRMPHHPPKVSIGMPVYNGASYLEEALQSVLAQSYEDFDVVISDNASTDTTEEICRTYAGKDERIRYFRLRQNYGMISNFNNVYRLSTGQYFKWAASDDVCGRDYLLNAVQALEEDPSIVLAWATPVGIDGRGQRVHMAYEVSDLNSPNSVYSPDPTVRFRRLLRNIWWTQGPFHGLIRAATLAQTRWVVPPHIGCDHILLSELSLKGRFYEIPGELFFSRVHSGSVTRQHTNLRERATLIDQKPSGAGIVGWWRMLRPYPLRIAMYSRIVADASLPLRMKLVCEKEVLRAAATWGIRRIGQIASVVSTQGPGLH
jgi:hypothetical protein